MGRYYYFVAADNEQALEHFAMAKSELYNDAALLNAISSVQIEQNKFEEALENLSKAADLDPLNAKRHYLVARVLRSLRRFTPCPGIQCRRPKASIATLCRKRSMNRLAR